MPRTTSADVVIVGGGIIGCLTAYYLSQRGLKAAIVEADAIASGASGASGGWLTPYSASSDPAVIALAPATAELHRQLAASLPGESGIDYRYSPVTYLRTVFTEKGVQDLKRWQALRLAEGAPVQWLEPEEARTVSPDLTGDILGAVRSDIEPTVDSYLLTLAAATAAEKKGASIVTGRVVGLVTGKRAPRASEKAATGVRLEDGSEISAGTVVLAMGPWTGQAGDWLGYKVPIRPLKGQMLHLAPPGPADGKEFKVAMSAFDLGGSILPKKNAGTIVGSTREDVGFDRTVTSEARDLMLAQGARLSKRVLSARLARQTACLRPLTPDQKPYVGPAPHWRGVFLAAGHYSEGINFGPVTGKTLSEMIVDGKSTHDLTVYSPQRLLASG